MNTHDIELPKLPAGVGFLRISGGRINIWVDNYAAEQQLLSGSVSVITTAQAEEYAIAAIEADRQRRGEPVAFAKDGVLFWHGEHATWRGFNGDLYLAPQPIEPQECGCCGRSDGCDPDCDAVQHTALREMVADHDDDTPAACYVEALIEADQERESADPNPPESPDSCDAARWQKARTLPRSWWRDAFNRIQNEGVTLDELIDAHVERKLP